MLFAWDAILSESQFQFVACQITSALGTFFLLWNAFHNPYALGEAWTDVRWEAMGVKIAFQLCYWALFLPVMRSMGYVDYKLAGGRTDLRRAYYLYRIFLTFLKFDLFSSIVLFLLVKVYLLQVAGNPDFALGITSLGLSVIFLLLGWFAITTERSLLLWLFIALAALQPAYIAFKAWSLAEHPDLVPANVTVTQFAVLGSLCIGLRIAAVISAFRCYLNFGKGLKTIVFQGKRAQAQGQRRRIDLLKPRHDSGDVFLASNAGGEAAGEGLLDGQYTSGYGVVVGEAKADAGDGYREGGYAGYGAGAQGYGPAQFVEGVEGHVVPLGPEGSTQRAW